MFCCVGEFIGRVYYLTTFILIRNAARIIFRSRDLRKYFTTYEACTRNLSYASTKIANNVMTQLFLGNNLKTVDVAGNRIDAVVIRM